MRLNTIEERRKSGDRRHLRSRKVGGVSSPWEEKRKSRRVIHWDLDGTGAQHARCVVVLDAYSSTHCHGSA
jgi:hypothetical protein